MVQQLCSGCALLSLYDSCMYVCIYIYTHTHTHTHTYIYIYIYIYIIYIYIYTHTHTYIHTDCCTFISGLQLLHLVHTCCASQWTSRLVMSSQRKTTLRLLILSRFPVDTSPSAPLPCLEARARCLAVIVVVGFETSKACLATWARIPCFSVVNVCYCHQVRPAYPFVQLLVGSVTLTGACVHAAH